MTPSPEPSAPEVSTFPEQGEPVAQDPYLAAMARRQKEQAQQRQGTSVPGWQVPFIGLSRFGRLILPGTKAGEPGLGFGSGKSGDDPAVIQAWLSGELDRKPQAAGANGILSALLAQHLASRPILPPRRR